MRDLPLGRAAAIVAVLAAFFTMLALPALAGWTPQEAAVVHEDTKIINNLNVAVNADGDALAVYTQPSASGTAVLATRRTDGVWSTPAPVGDGPGSSVSPFASIDSAGNATVVWSRWSDSKTISYVVRPAGGAWSAPAELSAQGESLDVTTGPTGVVSAVWKSPIGAGVTVAEKPVGASTWTVAQLNESGGFSPTVAAAPDGRVAVAWDSGTTLQVRIRASGGTWAAASAETASGTGPENLAAHEPVIAFGADGLLYAAWEEWPSEGTQRVRTSSRGAAGDWTVHPDPLSAPHWTTTAVGIVADASGDVTVAWWSTDQQESGPWIQRIWATTRHDGAWETGFPLTGPDPGGVLAMPRLLIDGDGLVTAIWGQDYKVMANHRDGVTPWLAAPEQVSRENSHWPTAAVDGSGKVLALWSRSYWTYDPSVYHALLETKTYDATLPPGDTTGPTTTMTKPGKPYYLATTVPLAWTATDDQSAVTDYRWRLRAAPWNAALPSTWDIFTIWTSTTSASYATRPGRTYCFSAQARDSLGNEGAWSSQRCMAAPVDDRQADRAGSWTKKSASGFYRGTAVVSSVRGSKLTLVGAQAKRIALVVDKRPGAGKVAVFFRGVKLGTWSLASATTKHQVVIPVKTWASVRTGKLVVKVASSGKPVYIDGVVVGRV